MAVRQCPCAECSPGETTTIERDNIARYYERRAEEYERVYGKPERQADLAQLKAVLSKAFAGERVLEIACGTGYWTQFISKSADAIFATDCNAAVIDLAHRKDYGSCSVAFALADAYSLDEVPYGCTAGFHGFWWSHVPLAKIDTFLSAYHARLPEGARIVMIDNAYVEGSSTPISRTDQEGNTCQIRKLQDGSQHEVLKNFPTEASLRRCLSEHATDVTVTSMQYYWLVEYRTGK
jgi:SAM-dependent methyltransferase